MNLARTCNGVVWGSIDFVSYFDFSAGYSDSVLCIYFSLYEYD